MSSSDAEKQLQELAARYLQKLPATIDSIVAQWHKLRAGSAAAELHSDLYIKCHSLNGSAKTFGLAKVGALSAQIESMLAKLEPGIAPPEATRSKLEELFKSLQNLPLEPDTSNHFLARSAGGDDYLKKSRSNADT